MIRSRRLVVAASGRLRLSGDMRSIPEKVHLSILVSPVKCSLTYVDTSVSVDLFCTASAQGVKAAAMTAEGMQTAIGSSMARRLKPST